MSFNQDKALAELIAAGLFFLNDTQDVFWEAKEEKRTTIYLELNCNDLFAWACAESMEVTLAELPDLYERHKADPKYGSEKWACIKANLAPQRPIRERMIADGAWDDEMDVLPLSRANE